MGLLDSSCGRGRFASSLCGQLFPGGLASGGLTGSLLGTGHGVDSVVLMSAMRLLSHYIYNRRDAESGLSQPKLLAP